GAPHAGRRPTLASGAEVNDAEGARERGKNAQVRGPGMNRAHEPAKLHAGHDILHAFERFVSARAVIEEQENSCADLNYEQKQGDSAQKIPVGKSMNGNGLFLQGTDEVGPVEPLIEPSARAGESAQVMHTVFVWSRVSRGVDA